MMQLTRVEFQGDDLRCYGISKCKILGRQPRLAHQWFNWLRSSFAYISNFFKD